MPTRSWSVGCWGSHRGPGSCRTAFSSAESEIPPGEQLRAPAGVLLSVFDQGDWVPLAALLMRPIWKMSPRETAGVFGIAVAVHVPINLIGYAIGARQRPI